MIVTFHPVEKPRTRDIATEVEEELRSRFEKETQISIHIEPADDITD